MSSILSSLIIAILFVFHGNECVQLLFGLMSRLHQCRPESFLLAEPHQRDVAQRCELRERFREDSSHLASHLGIWICPISRCLALSLRLNPFPWLIISDMIRISGPSVIVPRASGDRPSGPGTLYRMYTKHNHRVGPTGTARRRAPAHRSPPLAAVPESPVGDDRRPDSRRREVARRRPR